MGEDQIDRLLRKVVKGRTFRDDVAEKCMVLLNEGLLGGTHGVAEEQRDFLLAFPVILEGEDIGELPAVVAQEDTHQGSDGDSRCAQAGFQF